MNGVGSAAAASFDSAAETKPTGTPTTRAGLTPSSRTRRATSSSAVGALPTAIRPPSIRPSRCALRIDSIARVEFWALAVAMTSSSEMKQWTAQPYDFSRSSLSPTEIILTSTTMGQPRRSAAIPAGMAPAENCASVLNSKSAVAWMIRRTTCHSSGAWPCGAGLLVDDREAPLLDAPAQGGHLAHVVHGRQFSPAPVRVIARRLWKPAQQGPVEIDEVGADLDLPPNVARAVLDDLAADLRGDVERPRLRTELEHMPRGVGLADGRAQVVPGAELGGQSGQKLHVHLRAGRMGHHLAVGHLGHLAHHAHDRGPRDRPFSAAA